MTLGLIPLLLVLATSFASAGFDLFRKSLGAHLKPVPMVFLLATASVPLFAVAVIATGNLRVEPGYALPAAASVVLNVVANLTFVQAVRLSPLSLTVPLLSLTPAFTALLGLLLLGERPTLWTGLGLACVVVGAFWLNAGAAAADGSAVAPTVGGRLRAAVAQPGVWLMALTALLISVTIPLDKLAVRHAPPAFHGLVLTAGIALGALALLLVQRRTGELAGLRQGRVPFVLALASSTLALGFQLVALRVVLVSVLETLKRGLGNLLAVVLGCLVFGEPLSVQKLAAAALMAAGVAMILI